MKCNDFFQDIDQFLSQFSGTEVIYCPNPGNAGDSVIAAATLQLFERHHIKVEWVSHDVVLTAGKVVFFGGGGNWIPEYHDCASFVIANHRQAQRMVILPHTVVGQEELLGTLGGNVHVILREPKSFEHCKKYATSAQVYLSEDMALHLNVGQLAASALRLPKNFQISSLRAKRSRRVKRLFWQQALARRLAPWRVKHLRAFRTDREKWVDECVESGNLDLSDIFMYRTESPEAVWLAAYHLVRYLQPYQSVATDRLHVAITAGLLGKFVKFYPNSYFKNEAIYRYSLQSRFPKMQWMGEEN